jgi:hypothetical protein
MTVSVSILQWFQAREWRRQKEEERKKEWEDKNDEDKDGVLRPPVVASGGIKGPLHAWQSRECTGAKR